MRRSKSLIAAFLLVAIILLLGGFTTAMLVFDWGNEHDQNLLMTTVPMLVAFLSAVTLVLFRNAKVKTRTAKPNPPVVSPTHPMILSASRTAPRPDGPPEFPCRSKQSAS